MKNFRNLKIYNSLTKSKESFETTIPNKVGIYVCGPTVYSDVHLGNCRTFVFFDIVYRYLKFLGYEVNYVRNITDVGHLENDADEGEDKISKKARQEKIDPYEIANKYTKSFHEVLEKFNTKKPTTEPKATEHITEQIAMIKEIINNNLAYEINGSVYFDVLAYKKNKNYGILSGRNIEDLIHNTRQTEGQSEKKNPQDFALWKKASPTHIMRWHSPWSDGFPGWHLECSAMGNKYLGNQFEIHGGGMDLKFPHHECEIAQIEASKNITPVKYWIHSNMLTLNGKKMSKSTGNTLLPNEIFTGKNKILSKKFAPSVVRFFMLQAHYRNILDFSNDALMASEKGFYKLFTALEDLSNISPSDKTSQQIDIERWREKCYNAMNDDFNTPIIISHLFDAVKIINKLKLGEVSILQEDLQILSETLNGFTKDVLGLKNEHVEKIQIDETQIKTLIQKRDDARADKNWKLSDQIRDELKSIGVTIKDSKDGTSFTID